MPSKPSSNRDAKTPAAGGSSSSRQPKESSSTSKKSSQSYALKEYLLKPERHETWDWEQKAKRRSDKDHRL